MSPTWLRKTVDNWDRLITYSCFSAFGIAAMIGPTPIIRNDTTAFSFAFNFELVLAGFILIASVYRESAKLRILGYVIYLIGLVTIAGLIMVNTSSPFWILVIAFVFQGIVSVRYIAKERHASEELAALAREFTDRRSRGG